MPGADTGDRPPSWVCLALAGVCVAALTDLPYGYYQILRLAVTAYAAWIAIVSHSQQRVTWAWTFGFLALLYNPFIKITLDRDTWGLVNIVTSGIILIEFWKFRDRVVRGEPTDPV